MRIDTEELLQELWGHVYGAAYSVTGSRMDAEDAAQDAFVRYHTCRKEFENREHIRAWLIRVAVNRARDLAGAFWRRNRVSLEDAPELQENAPGADEEQVRAEKMRDLRRAVWSLPGKYRAVLYLYYYEDCPCEEIAKALGMTSAGVRKRLSRARGMLKELLSEEWKDD
ncbi:MAG: sigma-70 family RNA polymerase sigma factor [Lachnospiraceae bacterium]|nr:sigma-70 family RNA polymerase sigma factor [Lachnospiraceae bacterium]